MRTMTARAFNQDLGSAKRFAEHGPVIVTDRGRPTHVLLGIGAYRQLTGEKQGILGLVGAVPGSPALHLP